MDERPTSCLLISDFNASNLCGLLGNDPTAPLVEAHSAPFGQVAELLLDSHDPCWQANPDIAFVWTRPQAVIESFAMLMNFADAAPEQLLADVDRYSSALAGLVGRVRHVFVPTWVLPHQHRGLGMIDLTHSHGWAGALLAMNARLAQNLRSVRGVFLLDAQRWVTVVGKTAFNPQLWYMAKVPYANGVFSEAVADLKAALAGLGGRCRKLVILDLDDTLWGGIVGDVGWERLKLGGHDPIGEAFADFQQALKALKNRGIALGVVSKNEESVALEAFRRHPEMRLSVNDLAGWRINWNDKAQNITDLTAELNLGLDAVVFIDDNPVERDRVRQALPEVLVPEWPADKMLYPQALAQLRCFDSPHLTSEDQGRAGMYVAERQRRHLAQELESVDDFLRRLLIRITVEPLAHASLDRAAQLLNKTNQMNLATRRLSAVELWAWSREPERRSWTFRVSDKFGDSGLVGLVSFLRQGDQGEIADFILSCRVFGRRVEETMLHVVIRHARSVGVKALRARYLPTDKNKPTLNFLKRSGLAEETGGCFVWDTARDYPALELVTLEQAETASFPVTA